MQHLSRRLNQNWIKRLGAHESGDNYLDTHRAEVGTFQLQVLDKHKQTGKHTSYWLAVRNVSEQAYDGVTSVKVAYPVFNRLNPGDLYCAQIHPGALGVRWESFSDCQ